MCYSCNRYFLLLYVCCSMDCPWPNLKPKVNQGEWTCFCIGFDPNLMAPWNQLCAFRYIEREALGWVMCWDCKGIWQHTHSPMRESVWGIQAEKLEFGETMKWIYHVCK